ncbi:COP9 signalosome complex subunit 7a [Escovopsis weberi]|uniref:COP9 signalosome complex subunit 7a n=1 Tax=Escovopsis weberi TaxID=150374 RepID=A0A0M8N2U7_ESCWE|nr:COP9 signalosome complex subunit 7a [Escovopsis weberi]
MEHAGALAALEPFLALSKSATGPRAAAELVTRATSDPHTFFFAELLHTPQIQALAASPEHEPALRLLRIFSHGLYQDYAAAAHDLPPLSEPQALKLRQLSLVSLARDRAALAYPALQAALRLDSPRDVEDLAVTAIHAGLLRATLDPARQLLRVSAIAPVRDIAPGAVPDMVHALQGWAARCSETLADLDAQIAAIHDAAARRGRDASSRREKQDRVLAEVREADSKMGAGGGGHSHFDRMQPYGRDALSRRGLNKRSILDSVKAAGDDSMDIDQPHLGDDKSKRASKRKM